MAGNCAIDGAGDEIRTRDIHLGKVMLYQLSYSRMNSMNRSKEVLVLPYLLASKIISLAPSYFRR
jgi:hypothetical protein